MRTLSLLALLFALALPVQAQRQQRSNESPPGERVIERFDRSLDLTEALRTQMQTLLRSHADERQAERERMRAERQALQNQLLSVLTPAQRAKLEAEQAERREEQVDRRVRQMTRQLNLTDAQQTRVRALLEAQPTRHDRDAGANPRQQMEQVRSQLNEILTPEQRERVDEMKQRTRRGDRMRGGRGGRRGSRR